MGDLSDRLSGRFLVIDGPDGAGKSTQIKLLGEHLRAAGVEVVAARDPGGTAIGDRIRQILLDPACGEMTIACEILLYMASRAQLMGEVIRPALDRGACALCDRWVSSTVAYQVAEGKAAADDVLSIYRLALEDARPDLTVILDIPAERGLGRIARGFDRLEAKGEAYHRKVRELFLAQVEHDPKHYAVIDADGDVEAVQERLRACVDAWEFHA
jgi:dTMP kinase